MNATIKNYIKIQGVPSVSIYMGTIYASNMLVLLSSGYSSESPLVG